MSFAHTPDSTKPVTTPARTPGVAPLHTIRSSSMPPRVYSLNQKPEKKGQNSAGKVSRKLLIGIVALMIVAGLGTGYAAARFMPGGPTLEEKMAQVQREEEITDSQIKAGAIFGVPDEKTFKDQADGVLIVGGLEGEGSHTLLREGDASQNVYLTSSVVDLDQFEGMEIKVWGETFKGQKAGWLMDVGRVEVVSTSGTKPAWYEAEE